jgi:hypothetical protein
LNKDSVFVNERSKIPIPSVLSEQTTTEEVGFEFQYIKVKRNHIAIVFKKWDVI